jgi:hypothetical protein
MKKLFVSLFVLGLALSFAACGGSNDTQSSPRYSIKGTVSVDGTATSGISVALSGTSTASTTTDPSGNFTFSGLNNGTYTLTPVIPTANAGYYYDSTNCTVTIADADATSKTFNLVPNSSGTYAGTFTISGNVTASGSVAVPNVVIMVTAGSYAWSTATDSSGNYSFTSLAGVAGAGITYLVKPISSSSYTFFPVTSTVTLKTSSGTQNFTATSTAAAFYLHFSLPDQYNATANYPGKTNTEIEAILFAGKTSTEIVDAMHTKFGITSFSHNTITYTWGTNTLTAYSLDQFIDTATVNSQTPKPKGVAATYFTDNSLDARKLYACVPISNMDGFSIRTRFLANMYGSFGDLSYDQFVTDGYLPTVVTFPQVWWPLRSYTGSTSTYGYTGLYRAQYPYDIYMFRIIDVVRGWENNLLGSGTENYNKYARFEVEATTASYVNDTYYTVPTPDGTTKFTVATLSVIVGGQAYTNVRAISLDQFITDYVMANADAIAGTTTYVINSLDGSSSASLAYSDLQSAYFLPDYNVMCLGYSSGTATSTINFPTKIVVSSTVLDSTYSTGHPYTNYQAPAFAVCPGE